MEKLGKILFVEIIIRIWVMFSVLNKGDWVDFGPIVVLEKISKMGIKREEMGGIKNLYIL